MRISKYTCLLLLTTIALLLAACAPQNTNDQPEALAPKTIMQKSRDVMSTVKSLAFETERTAYSTWNGKTGSYTMKWKGYQSSDGDPHGPITNTSAEAQFSDCSFEGKQSHGTFMHYEHYDHNATPINTTTATFKGKSYTGDAQSFFGIEPMTTPVGTETSW